MLKPIERLAAQGFDCEFLPSNSDGFIEPNAIAESLRPETLLVSIMHANNETGILQPIEEIAQAMAGHDGYFHGCRADLREGKRDVEK